MSKNSPVMRDPLPRPQAAKDPEVLRGALVSVVMADVIAEAALLGVLAADDDIDAQPAVADALEGRRHLRLRGWGRRVPDARRRGTRGAGCAG